MARRSMDDAYRAAMSLAAWGGLGLLLTFLMLEGESMAGWNAGFLLTTLTGLLGFVLAGGVVVGTRSLTSSR